MPADSSKQPAASSQQPAASSQQPADSRQQTAVVFSFFKNTTLLLSL
jgi:hypothetical protein